MHTLIVLTLLLTLLSLLSFLISPMTRSAGAT